MNEANQFLDFLSSFQKLVSSPETYKLDHKSLDHQFIALVDESKKAGAHSSPQSQDRKTSIIFANFSSNEPSSITSSNGELLKRFKISRPQQDELLQGWFGRIRAINCLPPKSNLEELLCEVASLRISVTDEPDFIECAAALVGMRKDSLLTQHTLTPFFNALTGLKPSKAGSKSVRHRQAYKRQAPFRLGSKFLKCCKECANEDNANLGFSYWRSSHQLPGMLWCPVHHQPLSWHPTNAHLTNPHLLSENSCESLVDTLSVPQVKLLKKYAEIAWKILNHTPEIDSVSASIALGVRARENNFRVSKLGKRPTPSSYLIDVFPDWWLSETLPRTHLHPNRFNWVIDGACSPRATRYTTTTLCILSSIFYSDSEDAINDLLSSTDREKSRAKGYEFWSSRDIFESYVAHKGVISKIAEELSLPISTVAAGLQKQGMPGLGKAYSATRAASDFLNGQSMKESCLANNASIEETEALVRAFCMKVKPALDAIASHNQQDKNKIGFDRKIKASARAYS